MADLAQLDLGGKSREAKLRALLEDVVESYVGIYPQTRLALAVWFEKSLERDEQHLLELFSGPPMDRIVDTRFSLLWKTGSEIPPFVRLHATSVDLFSRLLEARPAEAVRYLDRCEVLYFDKDLLTPAVIHAFNVITEPSGLLKGWYIYEDEYEGATSVQALLVLRGHSRPQLGLVNTEESPDFENCRGVLHVRVDQRWLPLSSEEIRGYSYYRDLQSGKRVYFIFEGGAGYQGLKFEVRTAPEYASRLLEKTRDDRYPEVYLRAVRVPAQPAA